MVLTPQKLSAHNQMLGIKIQHPSSTNFDESEFSTPAAKRLKRLDSTDSSLTRREESDDDDNESVASATPRRREIPDSEAETDDDEAASSTVHRTDLEVSLPPVKTDKDAIAEYEATRAAGGLGDDLQSRLGQRKWVPGKSSIYVDAFNLALETVLEDEAHLFDETEMALFNIWRNLSYEGQYLYVRLFLRKTAAWHRVNRLGYYGDIADLSKAVDELMEVRQLPATNTPIQKNPGEEETPQDTILSGTFTFADKSQEHIKTLEEASSLLLLDELKSIAKEAKVQGSGKTKKELLKALRRTSQGQSGLGWGSLKRQETEESVKSEGIDGGQSDFVDGSTINRDTHFMNSVFACTGPCIRLSAPALKLFERVHLVFYRSTEWTEKSLTVIILARISRRNFPPYIVSRSTNIFTTRSDLLEFEASIRTQFRIDNILEFNGTVRRDGLQEVKDIFEEVYPRWKIILEAEQNKEDRVYESGEGAYLRRFSPAWVYTRIVHKGTYVLGRFKGHEREHRVLVELLSQRLFHLARRGAWYQRKALLEEHYMWALQPSEGQSEEARKKHWKRIALSTCEEGLQDGDCHLIYHYDLQKRVMKLERGLKIVKREQHDFGHVRLAKPVERSVYGIRIEKETATPRPNTPPVIRRSSDSGVATPGQPASRRGGGKTIWVDEREGGGECSVEAMCLSWYRDQGWRGYHSEGGIVRTLFGYLFYDVLFTYVPNVFQTAYQACPLDLHTDAFYPSRASEINHRLVEIGNGEAPRILREVYDHESENQTCVVGIDWSFAIEDLLEIVTCFGGEALATVCKVMAQEYQQRGGGIPDLFLWRIKDTKEENGDGEATAGEGSTEGEVMFSEVKSENDRLSDTQRLWIHVLTGAGIKVELCNAVAKEVRVVKS